MNNRAGRLMAAVAHVTEDKNAEFRYTIVIRFDDESGNRQQRALTSTRSTAQMAAALAAVTRLLDLLNGDDR